MYYLMYIPTGRVLEHSSYLYIASDVSSFGYYFGNYSFPFRTSTDKLDRFIFSSVKEVKEAIHAILLNNGSITVTRDSKRIFPPYILHNEIVLPAHEEDFEIIEIKE